MVENQVNVMVPVARGDAVLSADEGEALAQFQQKMLQVVNQPFFQIGFGKVVGFWDVQEFQHVGFPDKVRRLFDELALLCQLEDAFFVLGSSEAEEKGGSFLAL